MKHSTVGPTGEPASTAVPISSAEQVSWQAQQIELAIARRAYELFQARGEEHGHDWEDRFQAEAEYPDQILCPVDLKAEVAPELAKVWLKTGVLIRPSQSKANAGTNGGLTMFAKQ